MTLFDASGTAAGVASTGGGIPALSIDLGGSAAGVSAGLGAAALNMGSGAGTASGSATTSGIPAVLWVSSGAVAGVATTEGDAHPQGAGTAAGVATATGTVQVLVGIAQTLAGVATVTGAGAYNLIVTGFASGQATVVGDWQIPAAGTAAGVGTASQSGIAIIVKDVKGLVFGTSRMVWSYPMPIVGQGTLVAHVVVDKHFPPIRAIVAETKSFRYLQLLKRGDLPVYLSTSLGPISPSFVGYTMYQKRPNGSRFRVGPINRTPVEGVVGEFYATGRVGELGQPGTWVLVWEFRGAFNGPVQKKEMEFRVLDAVLANDPTDTTERIRKFGWN